MGDDDAKKPCGRGDELQVGPQVGPDTRLFVRHMPDHKMVAGVMRPLREGESLLSGGVFTVEPKDPANGVYKVQDIPIPKPHGATSSGPAQVATDDYRDSSERTFGGKVQPVGRA